MLAQVVGKPSGVELEIGGQTIDLIAVPVGELLSVLGLIEQLSVLAGAFGEPPALTNTDALSIVRSLGKDGAKFVALVRSVLRRSAFYGDEPAAEDLALFHEWFELLDPGDLLRTALPKLVEATMISVNPPKAPTTTPPAPESSSDETLSSSTPSSSS